MFFCVTLHQISKELHGMKKIAIAVLTGALLSACGQSADNAVKPNGTDSTSANNVQMDKFESADGRFFDVRGKVDRLVIRSTDCDTLGNPTIEDSNTKVYFFDKHGVATRYEKYSDEKITRDLKGRITKIERLVDGFKTRVEYTYNKQDMVKSATTHSEDWSGVKIYNYNDQLELVSSEEESEDSREVETFTILDRDSHGNWTKRLVTTSSDSEPKEDGEEGEEDEETIGLEVREITYR